MSIQTEYVAAGKKYGNTGHFVVTFVVFAMKVAHQALEGAAACFQGLLETAVRIGNFVFFQALLEGIEEESEIAP